MEKKNWRRPVLTILVRRQTSEMALSSCKAGLYTSGPITDVAFPCKRWVVVDEYGNKFCQDKCSEPGTS